MEDRERKKALIEAHTGTFSKQGSLYDLSNLERAGLAGGKID